MNYVLDVNTLIALKHSRSQGPQTCRKWVGRHGMDSMATCALTEFGFIRISILVFGVSLTEARNDLADLKAKVGRFVEKALSPSVPDRSKNAANTTDANLIQMAQSAGLQLATFDTGIPGAELII